MTGHKNLITNQDKFLHEVFEHILPSSQNLFFLVGYFYFSGFQEIYQNLRDKNLKILVGMDIELELQNKIKEFSLIERVESSRGDSRDTYYQSLVRLCNDTDFFDSEEKEKAFKLYLDKIKDGSLLIKKTKYPHHAKMYLFEHKQDHNQCGEFPGTLVTGSSNLSRAGLKDRPEVNVILRDPRDYEEGKVLFDEYWESAIDIAGPGNWPEFENGVLKKVWINNEPNFKPFWLYVRVLDELFSPKKEQRLKYPAEISKQRYFNLKYQTDAMDSAITVIERHGGVIISDVVGLGKSIVASVVAYNLGLKNIIISPPHLKDQWEVFRSEFDFNARVYSSGAIKHALEENNSDEELLIIIDEAHKYRNEMTESYALLHRLCQGNKVILLTATPYSNKPQDVFSMIKLFQVPAKSTIQTVENLSLEFKRLISEYKKIEDIRKSKEESPELIKKRIKDLADQIRNILAPLIIRRTRLDLQAIADYRDDLKAQAIVFPRVEDPISLEYPTGDLATLYLETLEKIAPKDDDNENGFIGARYKPVTYLKDFKKYKEQIAEEFGDDQLFKQAQVNLALFMRRLLVSRFESSIFAFKKTLSTMIDSSYRMLDWFNKVELVPIYKKGNLPDVYDLVNSETDMEETETTIDLVFNNNIELLKQKGFEFIPADELKVTFKQDILKDIALLKGIRDRWFENDRIPHDPKLEHFKTITAKLLREDPERKLVVYTSYADTANYLYEQLKASLRVFKYTGSDASLKNKRIIKENFDAGWRVQKKDIDILIATDAISEGYNLHRAGAIFNYDIPYNPTRVIQRVGRINRINKRMFDRLFIYNFFPTAIGEKEVRTKSISTLKKAMINALLGEDTRVLTADEELDSYFTKKMREEFENQEELSWDTPYRNFLENLRKEEMDIIDQARQLPRRARIRRTVKKNVKGVVVFGKKGNDYVFKWGENPLRVQTITTQQALECFEAEVMEKGVKVSPGFHDIYQNVKANLFLKHSQVSTDKGKRDAINKVLVMKGKLPHKKDYLADLLAVMKELDALPEHLARIIRRVSFNHLDEDFARMEQAIPHRYLVNIMRRAEKVEEGEEFIIFAEEFDVSDGQEALFEKNAPCTPAKTFDDF
ncbi:MAG: helicase-related protein [Candidatus Omnitrophota bacterium]